MELKHVTEDFCYLIVAREPDGAAGDASWARMIRPGRKRRGHVLLDLCTPDGGAVAVTVSKGKAERASYRAARKAKPSATLAVTNDELQPRGP